MSRFILVLTLTIIINNKALAKKDVTLSGTIYDADNGETMIGATVAVRSLSTGTATNAYGFYSFSLPKGEYAVEVSFIGYQTQVVQISMNESQRMDIKLKPNQEQLDAIIVMAKKENDNITSERIGVEQLSPKELETIPVLFGEQDIIKALTLTPGVKTSGDGNGGMMVRGGTNSQNLILLDEAVIYNASHLAGFFSTFNSDAIKNLTLYKGTAPAKYGGRISSVMDVKMNEGSNQNYHIGGGIGLIASKLSLEGPIVKDKGSFLITGRRTYADLFMKLSPDEDINERKLYFYDLNLKANYQINENNRIYLSGYLGKDVMSSEDLFGLDWGNVTATLRWNKIWNSRLFSNTSLIYSEYNHDVRVSDNSSNIGYLSEITNFNLKHEFQYFIDNNSTLDFGAYFQNNTVLPGQLLVEGDTDTKPVNVLQRNIYEYGAYVNYSWEPNPHWSVSAGLRFAAFNLMGGGDFYTFEDGELVNTQYFESGEVVQEYYNLEPRFNLAYILNPSNSFKFSYTRNTQTVHLIENPTITTPTDIWISSSQNIQPEISDQLSLGYFKNLKDNEYQLSGEVYYRWLQNQMDLKDGANTRANEFLEGELLFGKGRSYGLELMMKKKSGRLNGWIAYTLSRTEKQIENINKGNWYPAKQDATHDLSIVALFELNPKWNLSATWVYNTGNAVTFPDGKYEIDGEIHYYYSERNSYRMPAYHRLDLGATCQLKKTEKFESSLSFSVYNAYGRKNAFVIQFKQDPDNPSKSITTRTHLFTYVPSITYNFRF
ncbi:TonB-dependent receptor [Aureibacter tunicatorum]|uniref:TonB-dependent receptor plug domain-containing protein n=1 Tax=Aureibacter tunicatorum TaxID=866807 RepID=A0AAE4BRK6_9BACT|nr:TonB-dependent receptor [Aureibacter tunicatorum]MDR6237910.1 hypothetical protein [Aureibacter tunicatorum]BDD02943.1 collagen-binding protein [Aureibacter tunicatorum]